MASLRTLNVLGQMRLDCGQFSLIESGVRGDLDALVGQGYCDGEPLVVEGFELVTTGVVGSAASSIQINTAGSLVFHPLATASGTVFNVPTDRATETLSATNPRVNGSFVAGATNYVGIDFVRNPDDDTSDVVQFLQPSQDTEIPEEVPLAKTADYVIYITTQPFGAIPGICPIAVVVTNSSNNVVSVADARPLAYALSSGGVDPDLTNVYNWPNGRGVGATNNFTSGDKSIYSQKDWQNAMMSRTWELGGGQRWFSPTADRNVRMVRTGAPIVSSGDWFAWDGTNLTWTGLYFLFDNSTGTYNQVANQTVASPGLTNLADGDCIYVDLDRGANRSGVTALQAVKAPYATLGTPTVPGSRWIIAWRFGSEVFSRDGQWKVNAALPPATTSALGAVRLNQTPSNPATPFVPNIGTNGGIRVDGTATNFDIAIQGFGASSAVTNGSHGFQGAGGDYNGAGNFGGGYGGRFFGGSSVGTGGSANGGYGIQVFGGNGTNGSGGTGGIFLGGGSSAGTPGYGIQATGGSGLAGGIGALIAGGTGSAGVGGVGISVTAGSSSGSNPGSNAGNFTGGAGTTNVGGRGLSSTGGASVDSAGGPGGFFTGGASTVGGGGSGAVGTGGACTLEIGGTGGFFTGGASASSTGGTGLIVTAGAGAAGGKGARINKSPTANLSVTSRLGQVLELAKNASGATNVDPVLVNYAANGQITNQFSHLGYQTGQVSRVHDCWVTPPASNPMWVVAATSGAASTAVNGPATGYAAPYLSMAATRTGGVNQYAYLRSVSTFCPQIAANTSLYFSSEFIIGASATPDANTEIWVGFTSAVTSTPTSPTTAVNTVAFRYLGGTDTNWTAYVRNAATANAAVDTGVAVATGTVPSQVLRIEMYGSASEAAASTIRFYINGSQVASFTTNLPTGSMYAIVTSGAITTDTASHTLYVGNVQYDWTPIPITSR